MTDAPRIDEKALLAACEALREDWLGKNNPTMKVPEMAAQIETDLRKRAHKTITAYLAARAEQGLTECALAPLLEIAHHCQADGALNRAFICDALNRAMPVAVRDMPSVVGFDPAHGDDKTVAIIGYRNPDGTTVVTDILEGAEAERAADIRSDEK